MDTRYIKFPWEIWVILSLVQATFPGLSLSISLFSPTSTYHPLFLLSFSTFSRYFLSGYPAGYRKPDNLKLPIFGLFLLLNYNKGKFSIGAKQSTYKKTG